MARITLPTQAEDAAAAADEAPTAPPQQATEAPPSSWSAPQLPGLATIVRMISLAFLVVSVSLLVTNSTTIRAYNTTETFHYNDIYAYRYALATAVIGLAYTSLHLLYSFEKKRSGNLVNDPKILVYEFLGDKLVFALLATGVGAAFGATVDLKAVMDQVENAFEVYLDFYTFSPIVSKFDDFYNRAYIPAIFLLFAFLSTGISSLLSSLSLINNNAA